MSIQISEQTMEIFRNLASISSTFLHDPTVADGQLRVCSSNKNVVAFAKVPEKFPEFSIFDMRGFLGFLKLMKDATIDFGPKSLLATKGKSKGTYVYCSKELVLMPPKAVRLPDDSEVSFVLAHSVIKQILDASSLLGAANVVISCDGPGQPICVGAEGAKDSGVDNKFSVELDAVHDTKFKFVLPAEMISFIPAEYKVTLSSKKIAKFEAALGSSGEYGITYFVSLNTDSTYGA